MGYNMVWCKCREEQGGVMCGKGGPIRGMLVKGGI